MKKDLIRRMVLEKIIEKVGHVGTKEKVEIMLSVQDFLDDFNGLPIIFSSDIPKAVLSLENEGKIKLINSLPIKSKEDPLFRQVPDYYKIEYYSQGSPINNKIITGDFYYFHLSFNKGLYRTASGIPNQIYPIDNKTIRFDIIKNLTKKFQDTESLSSKLGVKPADLRAQIAGLKKQIENYFPDIKGDEFIVGKKGSGYRLGDKITIKNTQ